jgi:hypothetical protein
MDLISSVFVFKILVREKSQRPFAGIYFVTIVQNLEIPKKALNLQ